MAVVIIMIKRYDGGGEGGEVGEVGCERNPIAIGKFLTFHFSFTN